MNYPIRIAQHDDIEQIAEITHKEAQRSFASVAWHDEPLNRWIDHWEKNHRLYPWMVALDPSQPLNQQVIAYAKTSPYNPREGFNWSITLSVYVRPDYQGQKIAHQLYQQLFRLIRTQGYLQVYARIVLPNAASIALHQRFGLQQTGLLPHFAYKNQQWLNLAIFTGCIVPDFDTAHTAPHTIISVEEAYQKIKT